MCRRPVLFGARDTTVLDLTFSTLGNTPWAAPVGTQGGGTPGGPRGELGRTLCVSGAVRWGGVPWEILWGTLGGLGVPQGSRAESEVRTTNLYAYECVLRLDWERHS